MSARSKAVYGLSLAGIAGSNPADGMDVSRECFFLSRRGFCDGPITRPEESHLVCCLCVWSRNLIEEA